MSNVIDQRVVEMRFDNENFEKNVKETMTWLDKLKEKLHLTGSAKGLEEVDAAAKKVQLAPIAKAAEEVKVKLSAMQIAGVTAMVHLTNSAISAGKSMVRALTVDPIKSGFQEYETQMNAVQTILANTQSKGSTLDDVNNALDTLNKYADQTIYNFTEMTKNIGTFTAAGVDLQTSVDSIKGIANLAAVSGSTSQQASTAMYQLSQALAAGKVSLMDWNSVNNAGMGGQLFQDALVRTSELLKTGAKDAIATYGSFRESLTQGEWLTTEVLTETLKQLSGAYTEADLIAQGFTEAQAKEITKLADTAVSAATEVKTFTQLWDVLKESAQSTWSKSWKIIVGDFEEAKALLTPLANFLTGIIEKISDVQNGILESALGTGIASTITGITDSFRNAKNAVTTVLEPVKSVTNAMEDLGAVADKVILGSFGNGKDRIKALTEAGYNYYKVQNKVNEKLGISYRHSEKLIANQDRLNGTQSKTNNQTEKQAKTTSELTDVQKNQLAVLAEMSDEQLRSKGYTEEQIKALGELKSLAEKLGMPVKDLLDNMDEINGRWLLIDSFKNLGKTLISVFSSVGKAFKEIFNPSTAEAATNLFDAIALFHRFTVGVFSKVDDKTDELTRTLKGLFAIIDIIATITGGVFRIAFKIVSSILKYFNLDILDVTAAIGDAIVKFRDWVDSLLDFSSVIDKIGPFIDNAVTAIKKWFGALKESDNIPRDILLGLVNGIRAGASMVWDAITSLVTGLIEKVESLLGIHSPSVVFMTIGAMIIAGLILGLVSGENPVANAASTIVDTIVTAFKNGYGRVKEVFASIGEVISGWFEKDPAEETGAETWTDKLLGMFKSTFADIGQVLSGFDLGKILAAILGSGIFFLIKRFLDVVETFAGAFDVFGDLGDAAVEMLGEIGGAFHALAGNLRAGSFEKATKGIFNIALAILVLAAAMLLIAHLDDQDQLARAIGVIGALGAVCLALGWLASRIDTTGFKFSGVAFGIVLIAAGLVIMAGAMRMLAKIDADGADRAMRMLGSMIGGLVVLLIALRVMAEGPSAASFAAAISALGGMMLKMAVALLITIKVIQTLAGMSDHDLSKGIGVITVLGILIAAMIAVSRRAGRHASKAGSMILKISIALYAMLGVIKLASMMDGEDLAKGIFAVAAMELLILGLVGISRLAGNKAPKIGGMLLSMSFALLILVGIIAIVATMSEEDLKKGVGVVAVLEALFAGLIFVSKFAGPHAAKAGLMLIEVGAALLILTAVIFIVSQMDGKDLAKGLVVVGILEALFAGLIFVTKFAQDVKGTLIVITVAIGILVAALVILSFIKWEALWPAMTALGVVMGMFAGIIAATKFLKTGGWAIATLIVLTAIVGALAGIVWFLSKVDCTNSIPNAIALGVLMGAMAGVMFALSKVKVTDAKKLFDTIGLFTLLAVPMVAFAAILGLMTVMKVDNAIINVIAISALMAGMAGVLFLLNSIKCNNGGALLGKILLMAALIMPMSLFVAALNDMSNNGTQNAITNTIAISALMAAMTGVLFLLNNIKCNNGGALLGKILLMAALIMPMSLFVAALNDMSNNGTQNAITNAIAIGTLMTTMAVVLLILNNIRADLYTSLVGVAALIALAVPMFLFVGILGKMEMLDNAIQNAITIGALMVTMTIVLAALTLIGSLAGGGFAFMGVTALLALAIPMLAFVGILALMNAVPNAIANAQLLIDLMWNMTSMLVVLALIAPLALLGVTAMAGLATLMVAIGGFATLVGGLMTAFPQLQEFLNTGLGVMQQLAHGIGSMVSSLISGFIDGLDLSGLVDLGFQLSQFIMAAMPFIQGVKMVDETALAGVGILTGAILALTAADVINGVTSFLTGSEGFAQLGSQLTAFMMNAWPFLVMASMVKPEVMECVRTLAEVILILTAADLISGITSFLQGDADIATFGTQIASLGSSLSAFSKNLGDFDDEDALKISRAAQAIKKMAEAAEGIPNEGGWAAKIFGENSIGTFGTMMPQLGYNLKTFAANLGDFNEETTEKIGYAAEAIKKIAEAAKGIPNEGGWAAKIFGENSIATFAGKLPGVGTALNGFATNLGTWDEDKVATIDCAARAIKAIASAAEDLPNEGGWISKLVGDNDLSTFSEHLKNLGAGISDFADSVGTFDDDTLLAINRAVTVIQALAKLGESDLKEMSKNLPDINEDLPALGEGIASFCTSMPASETLTIALNGVNKLLAVIDNIAAADSSAVSTFTKTLTKLGSDGVTTFAEAFTSSNAKTKIQNAAKSLVGYLLTGIENQQDTLNTTMSDAADDAAGAAEDAYQDFYDAGSYLVDGFVAGINNNKYKAVNAGVSMVAQTIAGIEEEGGINSPSKVTYKLGGFMGLGFVNAMHDFGTRAYNAGSDMADNARLGLSNTIGRLTEAINSDIDTQPTIRPVLDLSDIESGAGAIGGLLGSNPSMGVLARVGAISSAMNSGQNGANSDVVSAIDKLRDSLSNVGGNTTIVDGITYDDGSNITNAVATLVRAAKIERRV